MVKRIVLLFSIFLIGCSDSYKEESIQKNEQNLQVKKVINENFSEAEKEEQDKNYLNSLISLNISDTDFLILLKYVIKNYHNRAFLDDDPVLGKNELVPSKDFTYPMPYSYSNIPKYSDIRVVTIRDENKNIQEVAITERSGNNFIIAHNNLNILKTLNLKFIKKEKLPYSNKIYTYYYTDGKLNYEIEAESSNDEEYYPNQFYSFLIKNS